MNAKRILSIILSSAMLISSGIQQVYADTSGWSYEKTFSSETDTLETLTNEGFGFEYYKPTVESDYISFDKVNFSYGRNGASIDSDYGFETYIFKNINSYPVNFNYTSSGTYTIIVNRGANVQLTKTVGSTTYVLNQLDVGSTAIANYVGHTYKIEVTKVNGGTNIKAIVKETNHNGKEIDGLEYAFDYTDTDSDKGFDGKDNGTPLGAGKLYFRGNWTGAKMSYLNVYEIVKEEEQEPDVPSVPSSVLSLVNDRNPYTGTLEAVDSTTEFTFDTMYSSVGLDTGDSTTVNNIVLTDNNNSNRLHQVDLSLYESNDNSEYTKIKNFTATKVGGKVYIYNFSSDAKYLKVHCHHGEVLTDYLEGKSFINNINNIIMAQNNSLPGANGGEFIKKKTVYITPQKSAEDSVAFIENGLLNGCNAEPLRFVLEDGYVLSHYTTADGVYIRIPKATAGEKLAVSIYGDNPYAADLSDMNNVFEVRYGNRTPMFMNTSEGVIFNANNSVCKAPNGDYISIANGGQGSGYLALRRSKDGGRTWSEPVEIYRTGSMCDGGGFMVDYERGIMWYCGYFKKQSPTLGCKMAFMESRDNGYTWSEPNRIYGALNGAIYSDGIKTKEYDGDGPAIDYVIPSMFSESERIAGNLLRNLETSFTTGSVFSRDNGRTWQATASRINYLPEGSENAFEAGLSESSIAYLSNNDLAIICRNQWPEETHYAQSVSHDNGFTWEEEAWRSTVTASNSDPNIMEHSNDILALWAGNTTVGGTTYTRFPLTFAYSTDDMKTWNKKLDIWEGTYFGIYNTEGNDRAYGTQPGFTKMSYKGSDDMFAYWTHHGSGGGSTTSSVDAVLIEDFENYLYKSKGAADDFEASDNKYESWFQVRGRSFPNASVSITNEKSKTGEKSLKLTANHNCLYTNRSLPQMLSGEISFDFYLDSLGGDCFIGYKDAYNTTPCKSTIYSLKAGKDGKLYALDPSKDSSQAGVAVANLGFNAWNNIKIVFDIKTDKCELFVNDVKAADLTRNPDIPDYDGICFMQIATTSSGYSMTAYMDNFIAYEGISHIASEN